MMPAVSVLTPTYNRKEKLSVLYASLLRQSVKAFEWVVVDDGSSDGTDAVVEKWRNENLIKIRYIKKENGGKHTALNAGIREISAYWTFIVDSDDWLTDHAIERILIRAKEYDAPDICGLAFLRQSKKGHYLTNKLVPVDGLKESYVQCRYGRHIDGDMAEVWKTAALKKYPFPEFKGEKFISEDVVWISMAKEYQMVFFNESIYISDYLDDGLTVNRRKHNMQSPKGSMYRGELHLQQNFPMIYRCKAMLYYTVYGRAAGYSWGKLLQRTDHKFLYLVLLPCSAILYRKWK